MKMVWGLCMKYVHFVFLYLFIFSHWAVHSSVIDVLSHKFHPHSGVPKQFYKVIDRILTLLMLSMNSLWEAEFRKQRMLQNQKSGRIK